jgi:hypothetical protein
MIAFNPVLSLALTLLSVVKNAGEIVSHISIPFLSLKAASG